MVFLLISLLIHLHRAESQTLFHGSRHKNVISLTFDACPSSMHGGYDVRIVQTLIDSGVPATFFMSGKWIRKHSHEVKKLSRVPLFELGNHTYSHPHCTEISDDSILHELLRTESLLFSITGTSPKLFRPPYGETDQRIEALTQRLGFTTVMYDLASGDPDSTISRERLIRYIVTSARNGSIMVMHVNGRGWHTAEALPEVIQGLRAKGFVFSKVSEMPRQSATGTLLRPAR
jgi:peptidoglycan-N-acetylglucosamine deacetylase